VEALQWVEGFVRWYNDEHLHSGIRHVTPATRHCGKERPVLASSRRVHDGPATHAAPLDAIDTQLVARR